MAQQLLKRPIGFFFRGTVMFKMLFDKTVAKVGAKR
jgi:hypothetical protein